MLLASVEPATVLKLNRQTKMNRKPNASAKSKEVQPTAQSNTLHHICFCPNRTAEIEVI